MLTINKPSQYGYQLVHDLPTPPSASRSSPPLVYQDPAHKAPHSFPRIGSPKGSQSMSAPHRGLPPPAVLASVQPPPPPPPPGRIITQPSAPPTLSSVTPLAPVSAPPGSHNVAYSQFPAAPSWHQEESMRTWLNAKAEEEKRKQEEERTRQESYRLEQRRMEHDILRTSLQGGIPPPMVPIVFAGMAGGALPAAALEWAQQYIYSQGQHTQHAALVAPGHTSPEHQRRDSQAPMYQQYSGSGGVPSTPGSAQGPPSGYMAGYPGSPTRSRGQSMPGQPGGRVIAPGGGGVPGPSGGGMPEAARGVPALPPQPQHQQQHSPQGAALSSQGSESQPSQGLYFHHWQPPSGSGGRGGGSDQPATPSGESPRKRKATGPQQAAPLPPGRTRSPLYLQNRLSNPPPGRRRGHSRQRSDLGSYRPAGRGTSEGPGSQPSNSPTYTSETASKGGDVSLVPRQNLTTLAQPFPTSASRGGHSVSSLLSGRPQSPQLTQYASGPSDIRPQHGEAHYEPSRTLDRTP